VLVKHNTLPSKSSQAFLFINVPSFLFTRDIRELRACYITDGPVKFCPFRISLSEFLQQATGHFTQSRLFTTAPGNFSSRRSISIVNKLGMASFLPGYKEKRLPFLTRITPYSSIPVILDWVSLPQEYAGQVWRHSGCLNSGTLLTSCG
jgi:hypothetical protein